MRDERWLRRERAVQSSWRNCTEASESRFYLRDLADRIREVNLSRLAWSPQRHAQDLHRMRTTKNPSVEGGGRRGGLGWAVKQINRRKKREEGKMENVVDIDGGNRQSGEAERGRERQREVSVGHVSDIRTLTTTPRLRASSWLGVVNGGLSSNNQFDAATSSALEMLLQKSGVGVCEASAPKREDDIVWGQAGGGGDRFARTTGSPGPARLRPAHQKRS
ncbi:predicted protein [Histoplasma capsulatum H143]|uniref:Uncharacterized protein n=1 Tax=Ajellomyces capsulatus (strain H143) TaxID=544712 RepID=C6H4A5_AJECH|nr:predicted protein [Histoplasma capsulatum H143]